jgi:hypothetical protein
MHTTSNEGTNQHYVVVENIIEEKPRKYKRGTLAFDFETRNTEAYKMVGDAKSFLLKDTICSIAYCKNKSDVVERHTFVTNDDESSARQFLNWLKKEHIANRHYVCVAHNGARFDNYLLVKEFTNDELLHTQLNLRGASVIGMTYDNHNFKDPCCFMPNSLENLCKSFKVQTPKLTEFIHEGKVLSNKNLCFYKPELTFKQFMNLQNVESEYWKLYVEYCEIDCVSLLELWDKFSKNVNKLIGEMGGYLLKKCTLTNARTIGGLAKKIIDNMNATDKFKHHAKYLKFYEDDDDEKYNFVCKFKRGGISHCNQAGKHTESVCSYDITSQYPTAMNKMIVPTGRSKWVTKFNPKAYGYYELANMKFDTKYKFKPISYQKESGVLEWKTENIESCYVDSEMIKYLQKYYGLKKFDVVKGLVSNSFINASAFFGKYVDVLFQEKAKQDVLKKNNDDMYNPALREVIKLFLNSLSGKLVEDPSKYFQVVYDNKEKQNINGISFKKDVDEDNKNYWVGCGVMVYSYSKRLLFEYIRQLPNDSDDIIHVETDGIYFPTKYSKTFEKNVKQYKGDYPVAIGDGLGNVKPEHVSSGDSYWLGKKFYYMDDNGEDVYRIKGIPKKTIDKYGNDVVLVNKKLYEDVYNGNEVKKEFYTLTKTLFGKTQITSHKSSRTIKPNMEYKEYK